MSAREEGTQGFTAEHRLHTVLNQLFTFVGELSLDGTLLHVNRAPLEAAGVSYEDVVGKKFDETYWWTYDPNVQEQLRASMASAAAGEICRYDVPVRVAGGRLMVIDFQIGPLFSPAGSVYGILASAVDVDGRVAAAAALQESESRFRAMTDNLPLVVWMHDSEGKQEFVNQTFCDYFGTTREEMRGSAWQKFLHPDDTAGYIDEFEACVRERRPFRSEIRVYRDNKWRCLESFANPRFDANGTYLGHIGTSVDITDRKQQEEVRQLRAALKNVVGLATTLNELRDPYTVGHEQRVAEIATGIGRKLGFDEDRLEGLFVAGQIHDVGKMSVPAEILSKPGRLRQEEFLLIKSHAQAGYAILKQIEFPWPVADMVLQHHERFDGSGYPAGLRGEAILLDARILAVADVVEAMSAHRPYRESKGIDIALAEIERGEGTSYDPTVCRACLKLFREDGFQIPT